jgi:predicted NUDIX family NTP pyrophosphohydrolase
MAKQSAGILLYRIFQGDLFVFLVHPGGPFFARKDLGVWSIPKGEFIDGEDPLTAARREFEEETGVRLDGKFTELSAIKLKSGKKVFAWACEGDLDIDTIESNTFDLEWPPRSGKTRSFPEIDRGGWFPVSVARTKVNERQQPLIDQLADMLAMH